MSEELAAGNGSAEERLLRLFAFCRDRIKRVGRDSKDLSREAIARFRENKSPEDTLRQGMGTGSDANMLFAALATAAGFKSRIARVADRGEALYAPQSITDALAPYFLSTSHIAVLVDKKWRFYDPASVYVPFGMLRWQEEGQMAMVCDPEEPVIVRTPMSPPEKSLARRTAKLKLDDKGALDGEVTVEQIGHLAVDWRENHEGQSEEELEKEIGEGVKSRISLAEISQVRVESQSEPDKPLAYSYRVRVPGYAEQTGSRLFLRPAYFQRGISSVFVNSTRHYALSFPYPWSESDTVYIELPEGYQMENPDAPHPFAIGKDIVYSPKISTTSDNRKLIYQRDFAFGGGDSIMWAADAYLPIKKVFDFVHEADNHTIVLKRQQATPR